MPWTLAGAAIFKCVDKDGDVTFSDTKCDDSAKPATKGDNAARSAQPVTAAEPVGERERQLRARFTGNQELVITGLSETLVFNNYASRLCYAFAIPGKWTPEGQPSQYRSEDGRASIEVLFGSAGELEALPGQDLVALLATRMAENARRKFGQVPPDINLVPITSRFPGSMRWTAGSISQGTGPVLRFGVKLLAEVTPGWVVQVSVVGTGDDETLAQRVLDRVSTTSKPDCFWPAIRAGFRAVGEDF